MSQFGLEFGQQNARKYSQGLSPLSFTLAFADMGLTTTAGQTSYADRFICVAPDISMDSVYLHFNATPTGGQVGVLRVKLIQAVNPQQVVDLTKEVPFTTGFQEPYLMPVQQERLVVGKSVYLRLRASAATGTQWWAGGAGQATEINGTIFFYAGN